MLSTVLNFVWSHWVVFGPLFTLILANIITKLTSYPDSLPRNELVGFLKLIQMLLDRLSFAPHKGTEPQMTVLGMGMNLPGLRSTPPGKKTDDTAQTAVGMVFPFLLALAALMAISSCCVFKGTCTSGAGYCASKEVQEKSPHLLPVLAALVTGADWETMVGNLAWAVGTDLVDCLMKQYFDQSGAKLDQLRAGTLAVSPLPWLNVSGPELLVGHDRAGEWLKKHGAKK